MKKVYVYRYVLPILLMLCGCTQNNGHIGPIFGSWALVAICEDGRDLDLSTETVFSFQNEVVQVLRLNADPPPSVVEMKYGNFSIEEDVLTLKFQVAPTPGGNYMYMTPTWLHFPEHYGQLNFEIEKLDGSAMILRLTSSEKVLVYAFSKTW